MTGDFKIQQLNVYFTYFRLTLKIIIVFMLYHQTDTVRPPLGRFLGDSFSFFSLMVNLGINMITAVYICMKLINLSFSYYHQILNPLTCSIVFEV